MLTRFPALRFFFDIIADFEKNFSVPVEKSVQLFQTPNLIMTSATCLQVSPSVRSFFRSFTLLAAAQNDNILLGRAWPRPVLWNALYTCSRHRLTLRLATYERRSLNNWPRRQRLPYIHFLFYSSDMDLYSGLFYDIWLKTSLTLGNHIIPCHIAMFFSSCAVMHKME